MVMQTSLGELTRPRPLPTTDGLTIAALWASLAEEDRVALLSDLAYGLVDARWSVTEVSQPASPATPVMCVLASLDRAITELSRARELLATRAGEAA